MFIQKTVTIQHQLRINMRVENVFATRSVTALAAEKLAYRSDGRQNYVEENLRVIGLTRGKI